MNSSEFLFDVSPYSRQTRRTLPSRPPRRSVMAPEVWQALLRVKRALDDAGRPPRRRRSDS